MTSRIGVFDSGLGGLTVLKQLSTSHKADYIYVGDSLRAPYGNKSKEELLSHTKELINFLKNKGCNIFVSACNSLSSLDTDKILTELEIKKENYIDMVSATRKNVDRGLKQNSKILIYATVATINSGSYQEVFKMYDTETLTSQNLAYAIEVNNFLMIEKEADLLVEKIKENNINVLFLGCTHYPLIEEYLEKRLNGLTVKIINPAKYVVDEIPNIGSDKNNIEIYTTKLNEIWEEKIMEFEDTLLREIKF